MDWMEPLICRAIPLYMLSQTARMLEVAHAVINSMDMDEEKTKLAHRMASDAIIWDISINRGKRKEY